MTTTDFAITDDGIAYPGGAVRFVPSPCHDKAKQRQAKIRAELPKVRAPRPNLDRAVRVSTYTDPAKTRACTAALDGLAKLAESKLLDAMNRRPCFAGFRALHGDGHYAALERVTPADEAAPLWREPVWLGELPAAVWRAYGSVRALRPGSRAIAWTFGADRVTFGATDGDGDSARAWAPVALDVAEPITISVDDAYAWPLRGGTWRIGIASLIAKSDVPDSIVIASPEDTIRIAIAGMRL